MRNWLSGWGSGHPKGSFFLKVLFIGHAQFHCDGPSLKKSQSHVVVMVSVIVMVTVI